MVKRISAILGLPRERCTPVPSNHTNMVKFGTRADSTYRAVVSHVSECVNNIIASNDE
jgi:hypothetical protein